MNRYRISYWCYCALVYCALPYALGRLWWRGRRLPAYRHRWQERFGYYEPNLQQARVWVHAVSVGEVQAAQPLLHELVQRQISVLVTTTTPTGAQRLQALFGTQIPHLYLPFDAPWIARRFIRAVQPTLGLVIETEIWPTLLAVCAQQDIPVLLVNARLSARSARRYARIHWLIAPTLASLALVAAQTPQHARRFSVLGVQKERLLVMGNLKFDVIRQPQIEDEARGLRDTLGKQRPIWIAASTHEGEEAILLQVNKALQQTITNVLLILVPRHPERFNAVADLVRNAGFTMARRSQQQPCTKTIDVYLADTMGELPLLLAAADVAFIGGSLVPRGGHNVLEAAAVGIPVVIGPSNFNVTAIMQLLTRHQAAVQIHDAAALQTFLSTAFHHASYRQQMGLRARQLVMSQRGALQRLMNGISPYLDRGISNQNPRHRDD
jgi:3-deoxy-D-manno-octulosonic-acid transferase